MWKKLSCWFIPHPDTHQKAHLLSWQALSIYIVVFILLKLGVEFISYWQPGVLGISAVLDREKIITAVNAERQKRGLSPLRENQALTQAAYLKAENMFAENYWAHFSPSGKDPWLFIRQSGYQFAYAGENLAKNFYSPEDVVQAWMASATHRDNILNPNYQDIGLAVLEGTLQGQKTVLVVQMFGSPTPMPVAFTANKTNSVSSTQTAVASLQTVSSPVIDSFRLTKSVGITLMFFVALLLILDLAILRKRGVFRFSSHHLAHLSLLGIGSLSLLFGKIGEVL